MTRRRRISDKNHMKWRIKAHKEKQEHKEEEE
jgi:hypothetical protein